MSYFDDGAHVDLLEYNRQKGMILKYTKQTATLTTVRKINKLNTQQWLLTNISERDFSNNVTLNKQCSINDHLHPSTNHTNLTSTK